MKRLLLGLALALGLALPAQAQRVTPPADTINCAYLSSPATVTTGQMARVQCDSHGVLSVNVVSGGGTGGTSSTFGAAFPAIGTAIGATFGGNMVAIGADASSNLNVNCVVGCAGGSSSNATSAVATSADNGKTNAWLYGFNGATWDQLQVDASKFLKVTQQGTVTVGGTVAATQSGTWTVQPGNTANTTPWLITGSGTAGTAAAGVVTIQGIASGTVVPISVASIPSHAVTIASGGVASGAYSSGSIASGAYASGAFASGAFASGSMASGSQVDITNLSTPIAAGAATATKGVLLGGQFDTTQKTLTNGQQGAISASARGALFVAVGADGFGITAASGAFASGSIASGAIASGAVASGAVASGAYASGSLASGAVVDLTNLSTPITPATATATKGILLGGQYNSTQATFTNTQQGAIQITSRGAVMVGTGADTFNVTVNAALPAGAAVIGKVSIDQTTPGTTNAVQTIPGTTGGLTFYTVNAAASDNHVVIKAGAGQIYNISAFNNNAAANYIRFYNATTGFNGCNSATNLQWSGIIPGATTGAGFTLPVPEGLAFATGISICITGAFGNTDTTNAVTNTSVNVGYK